MNKSIAPFALGIIVLATVTAAWAGTSPPASRDGGNRESGVVRHPRIRIEALPRLITLVMKNGGDAVFPPKFGKAVGIPSGVITKNLRVGYHILTVLYAPEETSSGTTKVSKELYLYFRIHKQGPHFLQADYYKTDLQGRLEMAFYLSGRYDDNGRPYGVSASYPDVHAPKVRKAFEKEMIFWLNDWLPNHSGENKAEENKHDKPGARR